MVEEEGGGRGALVSAELLFLFSVSQERAADRPEGCRFLPPPSLQLDTSEREKEILTPSTAFLHSTWVKRLKVGNHCVTAEYKQLWYTITLNNYNYICTIIILRYKSSIT